MSSVATINSKVTEAVAAAESGDYATAIAKLRSAQMLLSVLPDSKKDDAELAWDREAIAAMIPELQRQANAGAGIGVTKIQYRHSDQCDA